MKAENSFAPDEDYVAILYSDSEAGAISAAILHGLLISIYHMSGRVDLERVENLREDIREDDDSKKTEKAEEFLCRLILCKLRANSTVFVVTGGYKSVIPIFTAVSITHAIPMYYLFEGSKNLRRLRPPATVGYVEMKPFWERLLNGIRSRSSSDKVLTIILEHRYQNMDINYGAPTL